MAKICARIIIVMIMVASAWCQHVDMKPTGTNIFKETGSSVSFQCSLQDDSDKVSLDLLMFQFCNGSDIIECIYLESEVITHNTRELKINNVKPSDSGSYLCIYNNSDVNTSYRRLKVGYPPDQLNVDCISLDNIDLNCIWPFTENQTHNRVPTMWNIKFKTLLTDGQKRPCPEYTRSETSISCYWPPGDHDGETFTPLLIYTIIVYGRNQLGSNEHEYRINPVNYVKLTPVQNLAGQALSSTSILLTWKMSEDVVHAHMVLGNFTCQVHRTQDGSKHVQEQFQTKNEFVRRVLDGLKPYQTYCFSVRCKAGKGKRDDSWGEERNISVLTLPSTPAAPPKTLKWAYRQTFDGSTMRAITIFLKSVPMKQRNSEEIYYSVSIFDGNLLVVHMNSTKNTTIALGQLSNTIEYKILIKSGNNIGVSSTWSQIIIPKVDAVSSLKPIGLTAEEIKPGQYIVSFTSGYWMQEVVYCVYVWCKGSNSPGICKEDLKWKITSRNVTSYLVDSGDDESDWMFGVILVNTANKSSGIYIADCIFSPKVQSIPDILLTKGEQRQQMKVLLLFDYCSFKSRPVKYLVIYDRTTNVGNKTNIQSVTQWNNVTYKASMDLQYLIVSDLMPATYFSVCVGVVMRNGDILYSEIKTYISEAEIIEEDEIDLDLAIFVVFGCITFVCTCICALRITIQRLKDCTKQFDIDVPKPEEKQREDTAVHTVSGFYHHDGSNMSDLPPEMNQDKEKESRDICIPLLKSETKLNVHNKIDELIEDDCIKTFMFISEECNQTVSTNVDDLTETEGEVTSSVMLNGDYVLVNSFNLNIKYEEDTSREAKSGTCSINSNDYSFDSDDQEKFKFNRFSFVVDRNLFEDVNYSIDQLDEVNIGHGFLEENPQDLEVLSKTCTKNLPNESNYICIENARNMLLD